MDDNFFPPNNLLILYINTQFNKSTGLFANCADVGLLFRWIYAREKSLPIANTLQGPSKKLFGHFSVLSFLCLLRCSETILKCLCQFVIEIHLQGMCLC